MFRLSTVSLLLSIVVVDWPAAMVFGQTKLVINPSRTFQTVDSFGASDAWTINPMVKNWMKQSDERAIEGLADLLFSTTNGIGLSGWRFNIGAGSATQGAESLIADPLRRAELLVRSPNGDVDRTQQLGQIRMLQEAHKRGVVDFVAFANSPPFWATKNGLTHPNDGQGVGSSNLDPNHREAFAKALVEIVEYLRGPDVEVPVNYLSPLNEPTWDWQGKTQEGCPYNVNDIKHLYRAVHARLVDAGLADSVHVDGPEAVEYTAALDDIFKVAFDKKLYQGGMHSKKVGRYRNFISEFLGDHEMRAILHNKISLHGYFSDAWPDRLGKLRDYTLLNVRQASPDAKIWMSEFCILGDPGKARSFGGTGYDSSDMEFALHLARVMHRDLARLNVSAWHWWLAITPYDYKDGLLKVSQSLESSTVATTKAFWAFGNFSRFIRPGYTRVHVTDPDELTGLMVSAYKAPRKEEIVLVVVNSSRTDETLSLAITGDRQTIDINSIETYTTYRDGDLRSKRETNELTVPPQSVTTVTMRIASSVP